MKKVFAVTVAMLISLSASPVFAAFTSATDTNKTLTRIGTQQGQAYITLSPQLTIGPQLFCLGDLIYIPDLSTAINKAYYATLLTAYSQGKPLSRIDYYNVGSGTQCFLTLIEVN